MDIQKDQQPVKPSAAGQGSSDLEIRTMEKDRIVLEGGVLEKNTVAAPEKPAPVNRVSDVMPPSDLPIAESGEKDSVSPPVEAFERAEAETKPLEEEPVPVPPSQDKLPAEPAPAIEPKVELKPEPEQKPEPEPEAAAPAPGAEGEKPKSKNVFLKLGFIGLVLIIVGAGGFFYWWRYLRPASQVVAEHYECGNYQCVKVVGEGADQCLANADCEAPEPTVPSALMPISETKTIEIDFEQDQSLLPELKAALTEVQESGTFRRILVKRTSPEKKEYAGLKDLESLLNITLPQIVYENLATSTAVPDSDYTLASYGQGEGNRLVMIISLSQESDAMSLMDGLMEEETEQKLVDDLGALLLQDILSPPATDTFQDNAYNQIPIRYINFPGPDLSIDYAVLNSKLIIATSRESAFASIDLLLPVSVDVDQENNNEQEEDSQ